MCEEVFIPKDRMAQAARCRGPAEKEGLGEMAATGCPEQAEIAPLRRQPGSQCRAEETEAAPGNMEKISASVENRVADSPDEPESTNKRRWPTGSRPTLPSRRGGTWPWSVFRAPGSTASRP